MQNQTSTSANYQSEFTNLAERMGLSDDEYELAKIIWNKAVRCAEGKPLQEAALLIPLTKHKPDVTNDIFLTQQDLQIISSLLKTEIKLFDEFKDNSKAAVQIWYNRCDRDAEPSEENTYSFYILNYTKNTLRQCKAKLNKISALQRKVKLLKGL